jgi:hypothetical protein
VSLGWAFPAPLAGMFIIISVLLAVEATMGTAAADRLSATFNPALDWISKWLPLFYVPSLVTMPLTLTVRNGEKDGEKRRKSTICRSLPHPLFFLLHAHVFWLLF